MNGDAMLITITGLEPSTEYQYIVRVTEIIYKGGYDMKTGASEELGPYSFKTAGEKSGSHFCIINDTHYHNDTPAKCINFATGLKPDFVLMNGDIANREESIKSIVTVFLNPKDVIPGFANQTPYLFNPGNHDQRGRGCRELERA